MLRMGSLVAGFVLSIIATSFLFLGWLSSFASKWFFTAHIRSIIVNWVQFVRYCSSIRRRNYHFPGWNRIPDRFQYTAQAGA